MTESDAAGPELLYLLVDDHPTRNRDFQEQVSGGALDVQILAEASHLAPIRDDLQVLDGAIVDFHLNTPKRPGYEYLRYPCDEPDCPDLIVDDRTPAEEVARIQAEHAWHAKAGIPTVDVTTGLGAMLYIKQHAPDAALYGFCELNADHSLMFLCAAHLWLGASAMNAEYAPEQIRRALLSSAPEDHLPIHQQVTAASDGFRRFTDSLDFLTRPAEAFDWLDAYRECGSRGTLAEFKYLLKQRHGVKTLESDIYIEMMRRWQGALHRILTAFNRDVDGWPDLRDVTSAKHWDERNPVLDFLKDADYRTFFTAPDMRAALAYHRADQRRRRAESPLGDY
ncbi:MAG: hypothetical protein JST91_31360 [Actinobacteria bacterium]|nr:hypothetical protein [Actinomycetota bacterium]